MSPTSWRPARPGACCPARASRTPSGSSRCCARRIRRLPRHRDLLDAGGVLGAAGRRGRPPGSRRSAVADHAIMSAMDYRSLGSTGLKVSRIALGCGNFGGIGSAPEFYGQGESDEEAFAIMDAAYELGINVFDTADAYGGGRSETAIGKWLAQKGSAVRDQVLLSTKAFNPVGAGPNDRGLSRRALVRQVDASLGRLGAERLDLFLMPRARSGDAARGDARGARRPARRGQAALHRRQQHRGLAPGPRALDQRRPRARRASSGCSRPTACSTARPRPRCCRCAPIRASASRRSRRSPAAG